MGITIVKISFNNRYSNNYTCIALIIKDTIINIEESNWSFRAFFLLIAELPRSSYNILMRCSAIIIFQERERSVMHSRYIF